MVEDSTLHRTKANELHYVDAGGEDFTLPMEPITVNYGDHVEPVLCTEDGCVSLARVWVRTPLQPSGPVVAGELVELLCRFHDAKRRKADGDTHA